MAREAGAWNRNIQSGATVLWIGDEGTAPLTGGARGWSAWVKGMPHLEAGFEGAYHVPQLILRRARRRGIGWESV